METKLAVALVLAGSIAGVLLACGSKDSVPPLAGGGEEGNPAAGAGSPVSDASTGGTTDTDGAVVTIDATAGDAAPAVVTTLAHVGIGNGSLVENGTTLYANGTDGALRSITSAGVVTKLVQLTRAGGAITTDGTSVYAVIPSTSSAANDGSIVSVNLTTLQMTTLAATRTAPSGIAIGTEGVIWSELNGGVVSVSAVPVAGGTISMLSTYATPRPPGPLFLEGTTVFFSDALNGQGDILTETGTAATQVLASVTGLPNGLAVDPTDVYFSTSGASGAIGSVPRTGGAAIRTVAVGQASPIGIQAVNGKVVWVEQTAGTLRSFDTSAQTLSTIGTGFTNATATTFGDALYVALEDGTILRAVF